MACLAVFGAALIGAGGAHAGGDAAEGARVARQCIVCHSFTPGIHMTGPSLLKVFGRKAGSVADFDRYSQALKDSDIIWDADELDSYLANPRKAVPGTTMSALVAGPEDRANVIAFLNMIQSEKEMKAAGIPIPRPNFLDLKTKGDASNVARIELCKDTYRVTMKNGATLIYWERNLRFKTDYGTYGPKKGQPVLLFGGMHGDRASIVFASPDEISATIDKTCP